MLTREEVGRYGEQGFVVPDFRLPEDELEDIRNRHARLVGRMPQYRDYCPNLLAYDLAFINWARVPEILDMVSQVIGPDIALWNSSFFAKPALNGRRTPWHQDGEYWPVRPLATCTVWIAVDASTRENGCLNVIAGSHLERRLRAHETNDSPDLTLNQELRPGEFDEDRAVAIELEAGMISLHDVYLAHGSEANISAAPRRGMTLRYMPTSSVFDRGLAAGLARGKGLADHSDRTLFLMRGEDRSGRNDFRVRL